jgi:toxin ParE1/3/4
MLALETSPEAEADLVDIWLYIANDQPTNADRFLDRLQEKALKLAEFPDLGRDRPELAEGLKSFPVDRYNIYYRVTDTALVLVRVLPGSRDIDALF